LCFKFTKQVCNLKEILAFNPWVKNEKTLDEKWMKN
jgi:hypothetical protein